VLLLQKEKENLVTEYKRQREEVDGLKTQLQSSIVTHTSLAEQPSQSESVLQVCAMILFFSRHSSLSVHTVEVTTAFLKIIIIITRLSKFSTIS
jgi:hypothetical protein